jgi:AcrR family transcriptional regulator
MEVATKLFSAKGFAGTTVNEIAKEAGVNISLISYHFGGKENLFRACIESIGHQRLKVAVSILVAPTSLEELRVRLDMFAETVFVFSVENPDICQLLMRDLDAEYDMIRDIFASTFLKSFQTLEQFFSAAKDRQLLQEWVDPILVASTFFGSIMQSARFDRVSQEFFNQTIADPVYRNSVREHLVRLTLNGITDNPLRS